jgi:hypothetical protein
VPRQFLVLAATAVVSVAVTAITPAFSASMGGQRPGDSVTLSPQPLPPRNRTTTRPGGAVMLSPQPLPPGGSVMLSPQPLPPRILKNGAGAIR